MAVNVSHSNSRSYKDLCMIHHETSPRKHAVRASEPKRGGPVLEAAAFLTGAAFFHSKEPQEKSGGSKQGEMAESKQ